jgi:predicted small secreted protein
MLMMKRSVLMIAIMVVSFSPVPCAHM